MFSDSNYMTGSPFYSKLKQNSAFLLDNSFRTTVSLSALAAKRQEYGERDGVADWQQMWRTKNGNMLWNAQHGDGVDSPNLNYRNYWKLNSAQDLIDQFNYVGYHDICNYPVGTEIYPYPILTEIGHNPKGFHFYYHGFETFNQSGKILRTSEL